jgi:hypothetical protein
MMSSQKYAVAGSGAWRSMKTPKFHTARPARKYEKTRFSRLSRLRNSVMPASETFSRNATRGRSL